MSVGTCGREVVCHVHTAVRDALAASNPTPLVLAVSGGRDSVTLLDAVLAVAPARVAGVATFDHGTGPAARAAAAHATELALAAGLRVWSGVAPAATAATEAAWRRVRWAFLRQAAEAAGGDLGSALVATGHTADDQIETVLLRLMRGAGPRGLAGMAAPTRGVARPLLGVRRAEVAAYTEQKGLRWVEDPGNASPAHRRNRVRGSVLPAAGRVHPETVEALLHVGRSAASWRAEVEAAAAQVVGTPAPAAPSTVAVPLARLAGYDEVALRILWPAIAERAGVALDRRGTARLAAFTARCVNQRAGGRVPSGAIPVAGGVIASVERAQSASAERAVVLRRAPLHRSPDCDLSLAPEALERGVRFGGWWFARGAGAGPPDPWRVRLPRTFRYVVRAWRPGDRMPFRPDGAARRVKRFLADRHVLAADRVGWPVVVALPIDASEDAPVSRGHDGRAGVIVWIPGVRRSPAAPARPGEPGLDLICERLPDVPE